MRAKSKDPEPPDWTVSKVKVSPTKNGHKTTWGLFFRADLVHSLDGPIGKDSLDGEAERLNRNGSSLEMIRGSCRADGWKPRKNAPMPGQTGFVFDKPIGE